MGKIHKLTKGGETIYPATTTDAVAHPRSKLSLSELLDEGYIYLGIATPETDPRPYNNIKGFYMAHEHGAYTNFGDVVLNSGNFAFIYNRYPTDNADEIHDWWIDAVYTSTLHVAGVTGNGGVVNASNIFDNIAPRAIYRIYLNNIDPDIASIVNTNYAFLGAVLIDTDGTRTSLGDIKNYSPEGETFQPLPYYDYIIPHGNKYKLQLAARIKTGSHLFLTMENVTGLKAPYPFQRGSITTDNGRIADASNRIRVILPISPGIGFKRVLYDVPSTLNRTSSIYCFKEGKYVKTINEVRHGNGTIDFVSDGTFDSVLVVFRNKEDNYTITDDDVKNSVAYSDLDSCNADQTELFHQTVNIEFERGSFSNRGIPLGGITSEASIAKSIQRLFLKFNDGDQVVGGLPSGCTIYCYDGNFALLGTTTIISAIPRLTRYIKIQSDTPITNIPLQVASKSKPVFVKNGIYPGDTYPRFKSVSYEMKIPAEGNVNSSIDEYQGDDEFVWNNGYIVLPPNYDPNGKPVKLVIFCHGTGGFVWGQTSVQLYGDYVNFLAYCGFAVADCSTVTSKYSSQRDVNVPNKISLACYTNLYKYLRANFNIEDQVYIYGKSAGGMCSSLLSIFQAFPIKAVAELAGSLDFYSNMRYITAPSDLNFAFQQLGIDINITQNNQLRNPSEEDRQTLIANLSKTIGYNPILAFTSSLDFEDYYTTALAATWSSINENASLQTACDNAGKIQPAPMKIWHAVDDEAVPIIFSRLYQKMVNNAGGTCFIRELPAGTGGHHAVDNDPSALTVEYDTPYGGKITVPVAYAEMVDWFNQW